MICNMGLHYHSRYNNISAEFGPQEHIKWTVVAQQAFDFKLEAGSIICQHCLSSLDVTEALLGEPGNQKLPRFSQCLRFFCSECTQRLHKASKPIVCGHSPSHPTASVSVSRTELEEATDETALIGDYHSSLIGLPSKVTCLVTQLQAQPSDVKW